MIKMKVVRAKAPLTHIVIEKDGVVKLGFYRPINGNYVAVSADGHFDLSYVEVAELIKHLQDMVGNHD